MVREVQRRVFFRKIVSIGIRDIDDPVPNAVESKFVVESAVQCLDGWGIWKTVNGEQVLTTEGIENVIMMVPFTGVLMWTFEERQETAGERYCGIAERQRLIFSVSIETLQLLLRWVRFSCQTSSIIQLVE